VVFTGPDEVVAALAYRFVTCVELTAFVGTLLGDCQPVSITTPNNNVIHGSETNKLKHCFLH